MAKQNKYQSNNSEGNSIDIGITNDKVHEAIQNTAYAINSTLEFNTLLQQILDEISHVIGFDSASITLLEGNEFHLVAMKGFQKDDEVMGLRIPNHPSSNIINPNLQAIIQKRSIRLGDVPIEYPFFRHPKNKTIRSWIGVPLFARDHGIGTLNLDSLLKNHFSDRDQKICELFAAQLSVALENASIYSELKEKAIEQSIINNVMQSTISRLGILTLVKNMDSLLSQYCRESSLLIGLTEFESDTWKPFYFREVTNPIILNESYTLDKTLPGYIIQTREAILLKSHEDYQSFCLKHNRDFFEILPTSLIGVPLEVGELTIGALICAGLDPEHGFTERKFEFFKVLAKQISVAFQNANLYSELEKKACLDHLSKLVNRTHFFQLANVAVTNYELKGSPITLIMIDLDNYKEINDKFGHISGDQVLYSIAEICRKQMRGLDVIGRYGGDEFIVLLPETTISDGILVAQRLLEAISMNSLQVGKNEIFVTASLGLTEYQKVDSIESLINRADQALYLAKQNGRNRIQVL